MLKYFIPFLHFREQLLSTMLLRINKILQPFRWEWKVYTYGPSGNFVWWQAGQYIFQNRAYPFTWSYLSVSPQSHANSGAVFSCLMNFKILKYYAVLKLSMEDMTFIFFFALWIMCNSFLLDISLNRVTLLKSWSDFVELTVVACQPGFFPSQV